MRVWLTSVTEQWAVIAVQGPRSEAVLAPFVRNIDLRAMPHMSVRDGQFRGDLDQAVPRQFHRRERFRNQRTVRRGAAGLGYVAAA